MEQEFNALPTVFGFLTPVGFYSEIESLKSPTMFYHSKSVVELRDLLSKNIELENYERCSEIQNEISKRMV